MAKRNYTDTKSTMHTYDLRVSLPHNVSSDKMERVRRVMNSALRALNKHTIVAAFEKGATTYAFPVEPQKKSKKRRA